MTRKSIKTRAPETVVAAGKSAAEGTKTLAGEFAHAAAAAAARATAAPGVVFDKVKKVASKKRTTPKTYNRTARAPVMDGVKVTCVCGAVYEVIETKGPSREARPFQCVLCDRELFAWDGDNVGQLHLVWRPDEDRE